MNIRAIQDVPIDQIVCDSRQAAKLNIALLAVRAAAIKEHGVIQAFHGHREGDKVVLHGGTLEFHAAKLAELTAIPVAIIDSETGINESIPKQLVENCKSAKCPMDRARALDRLLKTTNWTLDEASLRLATSPATISRSLALLVLPADIQAHCELGRLSADAAYHLATVTDDAQRRRLVQEAIELKLTRDHIAARCRAAKPHSKSRQREKPEQVRIPLPLQGCPPFEVIGPDMKARTFVLGLEQLVLEIKSVVSPEMQLADLAAVLS
ncbi:MAG: ParB/RepB/Spo0J family partition protein [Phycisphaerales bacterium]